MKIVLNAEQTKRFCAPIIKEILANPAKFKKLAAERKEAKHNETLNQLQQRKSS
ncbi:hypothetical protein [Bacillus sp. 71mf]|uniref:hypothetical protein n=1 Tax=Bacillus sp. 71mf TaxID=1761757 RepID=UPI0008ECE823|nr:hypothetical protein [Bacillus sp. 71mf]SFI35245.1 hypothetical protein SAMN04488574_102431 [Bacillus sp. 71mf]SFS35356.1 hypothetical protein SAMN04488145_10134 [Bacillus sp. 103mf]